MHYCKGRSKKAIKSGKCPPQAISKKMPVTPVMIGNGMAMNAVYKMIDKAAPSGCYRVNPGEVAREKRLLLRWIHQRSMRADKPFVVINCATLQETLLEE